MYILNTISLKQENSMNIAMRKLEYLDLIYFEGVEFCNSLNFTFNPSLKYHNECYVRFMTINNHLFKSLRLLSYFFKYSLFYSTFKYIYTFNYHFLILLIINIKANLYIMMLNKELAKRYITMLKNTFIDWQEFESHIYFILNSIKQSLNNNEIEVYRKKQYQGNKGKWQVDVAYEFDILGVRHLVIIECKYYSRKVSRELISHFLTSIIDLSASKGILISNQDFTSGAKELAKGAPIQLLQLEEFYKVIENDLSKALRKELHKQIIDMRDEAIYIGMNRPRLELYGKFVGLQSYLSEYIDFEDRFPLPFLFNIEKLNSDDTISKNITTRIEYYIVIIKNIKDIRNELKTTTIDLTQCEYTQK